MTANIKALRHEPVGQILRKLAVPASTAMLINALYNIVDTIFVGRLVGWKAIAALAIANPIQMILLAIGQTFGIGAASIISRSLGANDHDHANKALGNSITSITLISVVCAFFGVIFLNMLLRIFGASSDILPYAYDYMIVIMPFCIFRMAGPGLNSIVRSEGNAKLAMTTMIIGAVTNIVLDPIFIYVLDMGIRGAAIATIISQAIGTVITVIYLFGPYGNLRIHPQNLILDFKLIVNMVGIGVPSFFRQAGTSVLTIILNNLLGIYGDIYISIYGIIGRMTAFTFLPALGIFQGMQPIVGYNYGAEDYGRVKEAVRLARRWAVVLIVAASVIIEIFPRTIIGVFTTDQSLIDSGILLVRVYFLALWATPMNAAASNVFQSVGNGRKALITALLRQFVVLVPVLLVCHEFFGLIGIFISFPLSDLLASLYSHYLLEQELNSYPEVQFNE